MKGSKTYYREKAEIISVIFDIIELQKGEFILSDTRRGIVHFQVTMYGYVWELLYCISDTINGLCEVSLRVIGERKDKAKEIRREIALLDTMLCGGAEVQLSGD